MPIDPCVVLWPGVLVFWSKSLVLSIYSFFFFTTQPSKCHLHSLVLHKSIIHVVSAVQMCLLLLLPETSLIFWYSTPFAWLIDWPWACEAVTVSVSLRIISCFSVFRLSFMPLVRSTLYLARALCRPCLNSCRSFVMLITGVTRLSHPPRPAACSLAKNPF